MRLVILFLLSALVSSALFSSAVTAEVFRYKDKNGNVVFTDEPPAGMEKAEKIEVREVPTIEMPRGRLTEENLQQAADAVRQDAEPRSSYNLVEFNEPQNESAFWSGSGNIVMSVAASPQLDESHRFEVLLDGQSLGTNQSGRFEVNHIDRGTHTATVRVLARDGDVVETGESITFTVHRPSVLN
ncbi:DUF4124 domain-containing protein [Hydrocarboniclastica marina]|uniref:DUF4124 domain-containing protein n=1 Tax=Hydrocarboniclastica marina TaxID=2259620 RepID=A0A4P7XFT9_9ALTE|nr:DUF4124 domain-containing protein [Hydrocarboniclastica marina]MAL99589.1 DUF4124 domain-containing protein [Alteromonadaceae bacterium]QCF25002.1 DUF4124 domain-containing protein [Hydrocarboniclastica marina]|tara:strand:- start:98 stop:652 length:555 start_codon:yes stop_codon:yes gene_type:complete